LGPWKNLSWQYAVTSLILAIVFLYIASLVQLSYCISTSFDLFLVGWWSTDLGYGTRDQMKLPVLWEMTLGWC
jgi:hypothetical protein